MSTARVVRPRGERVMRRAIAVALVALGLSLVALATFRVAARAGMFRPAVVAGDVAGARSTLPGVRVLFVGNAFTYAHDMPAMLERLVRSSPANGPIFTVRFAPPSATLEDDVDDPQLAGLLQDTQWDAVVLQEYSWLPSVEVDRGATMFPAARTLAAQIAATGAQTLFYVTPAFPDGDRARVPDDTYLGMQSRLDTGYAEIARDLGAPTVPVGNAFAFAIQANPRAPLWAADGSPSREGAYLVACTFYAALYHRVPTSGYTGGLGRSAAVAMQRAADLAVRRYGTLFTIREFEKRFSVR